MKTKIILLIGILSLFLISGCENSYQSCFGDCYDLCNENNDHTCIGVRDCIGTALENDDICDKECHLECKP